MRLTRCFIATLAASTIIALPAASSALAAPVDLSPAPAAFAPLPQALSVHEAPHADTILRRVNQLRASLGLSPVIRVAELDAIAQNWSEHMAAIGVLNHRPGFSELYPGGWTGASENVAMRQSWAEEDAGTELYLQWENSPGHYTNMTNPDTNVIGIGVSFNPATNSWYATQNFGNYPDVSHLTVSGPAPTTAAPASPPPPEQAQAPASELSPDNASDTQPAPVAAGGGDDAASSNGQEARDGLDGSNRTQAAKQDRADAEGARSAGPTSPQKGTQYIHPVPDTDTSAMKSAPAPDRAPSGLSATGLHMSAVGVAVLSVTAGGLLLMLRRRHA